MEFRGDLVGNFRHIGLSVLAEFSDSFPFRALDNILTVISISMSSIPYLEHNSK